MTTKLQVVQVNNNGRIKFDDTFVIARRKKIRISLKPDLLTSGRKIVTYLCSFKIIRWDALTIICNYNHCFTIFPLHCWRECTPLVCWMNCFQILCKLWLFTCISWKIRMLQTAVTICTSLQFFIYTRYYK